MGPEEKATSVDESKNAGQQFSFTKVFYCLCKKNWNPVRNITPSCNRLGETDLVSYFAHSGSPGPWYILGKTLVSFISPWRGIYFPWRSVPLTVSEN